MQKKYQNHEKNHLLSQLTFTYFKLQVKNFHYRKPVSKVTLTDHYSVTIKKKCNNMSQNIQDVYDLVCFDICIILYDTRF